MRRIGVVLSSALLVILASCNADVHQDEAVSISGIGTSFSNPKAVSQDTIVTLLGLEEGGLYGIFASNGDGTSRSLSGVPGLIATDAGSYLLKPDSQTMSFSASDVGIEGTGVVRTVKYEPLTDLGDMEINTGSDTPIGYLPEEDRYVFDEYYRISTQALEDAGIDTSEVAMCLYHENGGGRFDYDFGIVDPEFGRLSDNPDYMGVFDIGEMDTISICNQVRAGGNSGTSADAVVQGVLFQTPEKISLNECIMLKPKQIYEIEAAGLEDKELVLAITRPQGVSLDNYKFMGWTIEGVKAHGQNAGKRQPYIFPICLDNEVLLYVGKIDEDIIFPFLTEGISDDNAGQATLRVITEDEKKEIVWIEYCDKSVSITLDEGRLITPIIFDSKESPSIVKANFQQGEDCYIRVTFHPSDSSTFGTSTLKPDRESMTISPDSVLEFAFIINPDKEKGSVTLEFL